MNKYTREYPLFSLCGLNCGLCPHYQTDGISKCPGCGGENFHLKHPSCPIITCSRRHGNIEYCFQCASYPCERYAEASKKDSFISYQNVLLDFQKAEIQGLDHYKAELNRKVEILEFLISNCNDGKRKGFYCLAVNLLNLHDLTEIETIIRREILNSSDDNKTIAKKTVRLFESKASENNVPLTLRKSNSVNSNK